MCSLRLRGQHARFQVLQWELAQKEAAQGLIQWLDNYKQLVYDTQPDTDSRDKCLFGTPAAAYTGVHISNSVPWPDPGDLPHLAAAAAEDLASCLPILTIEMDRFLPARHWYETLCVPLDVVRSVWTGVAWVPQSLGEYNIRETRGLMTTIHAAICRLHSVNQPMSPILVHFDIYYRLLRAAYWKPSADQPWRNPMRPLPLVFGIWHAQKHVVVSCHRRFCPWFTALQYSSFLNKPGRTTVYYFPKVQELERSMLAVFSAAGQAKLVFARADKARPAGAPDKVQRIKTRLQSVLVLICRFVRTIIKLGIPVRECTWVHSNPGTGRYARQVMRYALLLILSLRGDAHGRYVVALFPWFGHVERRSRCAASRGIFGGTLRKSAVPSLLYHHER